MIAGCVVLIIISVSIFYLKSKKNKNVIVVSISAAPTSVDPYEYDAFAHHVTFRSVYATLVSNYKRGEIIPYVAESWKASDNFKSWSFKIRQGLLFENGQKLTNTEVKKSIRRIAYISKSKGSKLSFIHLLVGYEKLLSVNDEIDGIQLDGNNLILKFTQPYKGLLDEIGFGLYAIVSDNDWDQNSGKWKDSKKITSLGVYKIQKWTEKSLSLLLNNLSPIEVRHPNAFEVVNIIFNNKAKNASIYIGSSTQKMDGYQFLGPVPSSIVYIHCLRWKQKNSEFNTVTYRRKIRDSFYSILEKNKIKPVRSFFPLSMKDIEEYKSESSSDFFYEVPKLKIRKLNFPERHVEQINDLLSTKSQMVEMSYQEVMKYLSPDLLKYPVDLAVIITGILVEDPVADIKFMFESKEGINLPDTTGEIHKKLKDGFAPKEINQLLWDQAVIWPIGHFAMGIWIKDLDGSMYNQLLPPIDYSWLGSK